MNTRKNRGFKFGKKLAGIFSRFVRRRNFRRLRPPCSGGGAFSKLRSLGRKLLNPGRNSGYIRVGQDPDKVCVPRGHLAVYVGGGDAAEDGGAACRVVVPVIYFNHPLFADLLREAETVYGFDQPGRIQIPIRVSEFENVQSRIAAAGGGDHRRVRRSWKHRIGWC